MKHNPILPFLLQWQDNTRPTLRALHIVLLMTVGITLLTLSAKFKVPFYPVPVTMQTLVVFLIGAGYGATLGGATVMGYLFLGALGAPVFSNGGGLAYFLGPTGGYLIGFLIAAWVIGLGIRYFSNNLFLFAASMFATLLVADAIIFLLGVSNLAFYLNWDWTKAIQLGFTPFILADFCKIVLAVCILVLSKRKFLTPR